MADKNGTISASERSALNKIAKGRIELLRNQIVQRRHELAQQIKEQILLEHKTEIDKAVEEVVDIQAQARKLMDRINDFESKLSNGIIHNGNYTKEYSDNGRGNYYFSVPSRKGLVPKDIEKLVEERMKEFNENLLHFNLDSLELDMLEKIALTAVKSEEARDLLSEIPTIDKLLPMPTIKELSK